MTSSMLSLKTEDGGKIRHGASPNARPPSTPVYLVVEIIPCFSRDPVPKVGGGELGPHAVLQGSRPTPVAPAAAAPASGRQLVRAGVEETRRGAEEAV